MIDLELQDEIKNETTKDDFFVKALQAIKENCYEMALASYIIRT